jgi:hypothetical protein
MKTADELFDGSNAHLLGQCSCEGTGVNIFGDECIFCRDSVEQIKAESEKFFEWPGEDKAFVTTMSAILFARHCVDIATDKFTAERDRYKAALENIAAKTCRELDYTFEQAQHVASEALEPK